MTDQAPDRPSFIRPFFDTDARPYLLLAGLQMIIALLGSLLITTGPLV